MSEGFIFLLSIASRGLMSGFYTIIEFLSIIWEIAIFKEKQTGGDNKYMRDVNFESDVQESMFSAPANAARISVHDKHGTIISVGFSEKFDWSRMLINEKRQQ